MISRGRKSGYETSTDRHNDGAEVDPLRKVSDLMLVEAISILIFKICLCR